MVNIPQGNPTIYRSTFRVTVSESAIPALRFTARGVNLTEVECGQFDGESRTYTAPNGKGTCDLSNAYGSNNIFAYYTTAPANQGDISIAVDCSGIRCEP
jgi:phosphoheptose isomerase